MKKKVLAILAATMVTCSVGMASPLIDYSAGKTAIDVTVRNTETVGHIVAFDASLDRKYNTELGITTGLGNNFALQYRYFQPKSDDTHLNLSKINYGPDLMGNTKVKLEEINLLYKIDQNISAYMGVMRTKLEANGSATSYNTEYSYAESGNSTSETYSGGITSKTRNLMQVGLIGSSKINDKATAYGSVGLGKDLTSYQLGVSYALDKNWEFNVDYRNVRIDKYSFSADADAVGLKPDVKVSGVGFGLTYKF